MSSEPTPHDPGLFEITLGVLFSVILGGLLACAHLIAAPVEKVQKLPEEPVKGAVYYVEGSAGSQAGRQWMRKRQLFTEKQPGEIVFIEDELNAWARAAYSPLPADQDEESPARLVLSTGTPDFRMEENRLQIAFECDFRFYTVKGEVVARLLGEIERRGDGFVFVPDDVWLGGLPAGRLPLIGGVIARRLLSAQQLPDDLTGAWAALDYAKVEGRQLVLRMP